MKYPLVFAMIMGISSPVYADALAPFYENPVYRVGNSLTSCDVYEQGIPSIIHGKNTRDNIKVFLKGTAATVMVQDTMRQIRSYYFYRNQADCDWLELQVKSGDDKWSPDRFVADLAATYGARIHFSTPRSEQIVHAYNIECQTSKVHRYIPLINLLYASLASMSHESSWLELDVVDQDGDVSIVNVLYDKTQPQGDKTVQRIDGIRIFASGEMQPLQPYTQQHVATLCSGFSGPYWRNKTSVQ